MTKVLDTTKINHLIVERFHDDETGEKITVNEYEVQHRKDNPNYMMMDTKVKFQKSNCGHIVGR